MTPKSSWVSLSSTQRDELHRFAQLPGWRLVSSESIPTIFPSAFRSKLDSGVMIAAPTSSGGTYLVFNARRVDFKDRAIDQEPFAVIVHSSGPDPSGMFLHHGDWEGRTETPYSSFWSQVDESGVGDYFLANPPSGRTSGSLDELSRGDRGAFETAIRYLRSSNTAH